MRSAAGHLGTDGQCLEAIKSRMGPQSTEAPPHAAQGLRPPPEQVFLGAADRGKVAVIKRPDSAGRMPFEYSGLWAMPTLGSAYGQLGWHIGGRIGNTGDMRMWALGNGQVIVLPGSSVSADYVTGICT